jgi:pimeloyl-ACP methyl ester carboxylesterase
MVAAGLERWQTEMVADGYLVVSPVAPDVGLFTGPCAHARLPELMDHIEATHAVAPGGWHLFGISNGGRSALVVGAAYSERFRSVTVLPGATTTPESLRPLLSLLVTFAVGGQDGGWLENSQAAQRWLENAGGRAKLVVLPEQGHTAFQTVDWATLEGWMTRSSPR